MSFWRGFFPLLLTFCLNMLASQIDVAVLARLSSGAPASYVLLIRVALLEIAVMNAMCVVAAVFVADASRTGRQGEAVVKIGATALATGAVFGAAGALFYPALGRGLAGGVESGALALGAIGWWAAGAPGRFLAGVEGSSLHALGKGAWILRWGVCEIILRAAGAWLFIHVFGFGFAGCFISALLISLVSAGVYWLLLRKTIAMPLMLPAGFASGFLRSAGWEAQRLLLPQLAVAAALFLFALPWFGPSASPRLEPYAAGQMLILFTLTPLLALMRFLGFRLAGRPAEEVASLVRMLWRLGAPVAVAAAVILFEGRDWIGGAVYGQQGPWWSWLVAALAVSLPLRYVTAIMRGALQGVGRFAELAAADSLAPWLIGLPLIAAGLYVDDPRVAYSSLIVPEIACAVWIWRKLSSAIPIVAVHPG